MQTGSPDMNCRTRTACSMRRRKVSGPKSKVQSRPAIRALRHLLSLQISGLWLDGFAEMTPQELDLLAAILPHCEHASLAFCVENGLKLKLHGSQSGRRSQKPSSNAAKELRICRVVKSASKCSNAIRPKTVLQKIPRWPGWKKTGHNRLAPIPKNRQTTVRNPQFRWLPVKIRKRRPFSLRAGS